jgi:6-phosphogluconolactonase
MKSTKIFPNLNSLAKAIGSRFREESQQAAKKNHLYSVALAGGTTALKVYNLLRIPEFAETIPWESVHLFWTDERCVLPESNESNFGTINRALLHSIPIPSANLHRIKGEENPTIEANRYACEIQDHFTLRSNSNYFFDWILLGVGDDGHTASLFPQQDIINSIKLCEVSQHPETGQKRITMTPMAINRSRRITYHVIGSKKAKIISKLASQLPESKKYPAAQIEGDWFLDQEAASKLPLSNLGIKK